MDRIDQMAATERRAGHQTTGTRGQRTDIERMKTVHILDRINGGNDPVLVDMFRQGQLHQNAIDHRIGIHLGNQFEQIALRHIGRQAMLDTGHACRFRCLALAADIDLTGRILADQHDRQCGFRHTGCDQIGNSTGDMFANGCRRRFSINQSCSHYNGQT